MTIPNFKNEEDWQKFQYIFDGYWSYKLELLNTVKDGLFPGYSWTSINPSSLETINDITQSLMYDVDYTFKQEHPEYKTDDDECFIPRSSFKETVTEALKEALACADHLTDE